MKNYNAFMTFIIAFVLALGATNFSIFKGTRYWVYTLLEIAFLVPIGMLVIFGIGRVCNRILIKR
ncbi:hypothetical protein EI200_25350 [Peribacillus simplex]|uniref:hypothetical protein n=1 Tax=Peribacillus simplex TaxID=1478 RepID=UPI000F634A63|nr:hypothetical protein [Peribacillus simplex]RRN66717.1 hypothetical protein EI200_25350 [Peribacillus simplex]